MPRFVIASIFLFTSVTALAAPKIALVGVHQDEFGITSQGETMAMLAEAIQLDGRLEPIHGPDMAAAIKGREGIIIKDGFLLPGRRLLERGKGFYNQAEPLDAIPQLEQAIEELEGAVSTTNDTKELWEAWMLLGMAHYQAEDPDKAKSAWGAAVTLNNERSPNPAQFPPDVIESYNAVREGLLEYRAILTINCSEEEDVTIYLNGEEKGVAPVTIYDALPGTNHIVARGLGATQGHKTVDVAAGGQMTIDLVKTVNPQLGTAAETNFGRSTQIGGLYRSLADHANADVVLIAGVSDNLLKLQLYQAKTDAFSRATELPFDGTVGDEMQAALPLLLAVLDQTGTLKSELTSPTPINLDTTTNNYLAEMLFNPKTAKKRKGEVVDTGPNWLLVGGASAAGVAVLSVTAAVLLRDTQKVREEDEEVLGGTTTVVLEE